MEAAANARIQQILAGSSARAPDMRKRKLPEVYFDEQPARRHNSVISEGDHYYTHPQMAGGAQQVNGLSFLPGFLLDNSCNLKCNLGVLPLLSLTLMLESEGHCAGVHRVRD